MMLGNLDDKRCQCNFSEPTDAMKTQTRLISRWEQVKRLWDLGVALVFAIAVICLEKGRLVAAFTPKGFSEFPVAQMSTLLFVETLVLLFLWIKSTSSEYQILRDHFSEFIPPIPGSSFPIVIGLAVLLGLLCYFSDTIVIYAAIFAFFNLFMIWGMWVRDSKLREVIDQARRTVPTGDERREAWTVIENYYLKLPQVQLSITTLFFSFVALILGLSGELLARQPLATELLTAGYIVMVAIIAVQEVIYGLWRRKRNCALPERYT